MRIGLGIVIGILLCCFIGFLLFDKDSERDLAVFIHIKNDTGSSFKLGEIVSDDGRHWSCTFESNICSVAIIPGRDFGFKVRASDIEGKSYHQETKHNFYAEPGSTKSINLSVVIPDI